MRCSDGHYYAGTRTIWTLALRNQAGAPRYTEKRRPVTLVWSESFRIGTGLRAERQIKGWSRAKKEALIRRDWQALSDLARKPVLRYAGSTSSPATQDERVVGPAIVLVRPQLGENIGKTARAMLNFGLTDLRLVAPRDGWPNPSAGPAAAGADIVLDQARLFDSVPRQSPIARSPTPPRCASAGWSCR